jgi:hypothetical protein
MRTADLLALLERHYIKPGAPFPGGIFLPECGWNGGNYEHPGAGGCDALYVGFTSTSGRILIGHELKVSRADWLNELKQPGKSDPWADQCHEWWLVVSDCAIVQAGELPAGWGLMVPGRSKTRMSVVTKPDRKPATHRPSWTAVRSIMARQDTLRAQAISAARRKATDEANAELAKRVEQQVKFQESQKGNYDYETVKKRLKALEDALGLPVEYDFDQTYGTAVALGNLRTMAAAARLYGSLESAVSNLTRNYEVSSLRRSVDRVDQHVKDLRRITRGADEG